MLQHEIELGNVVVVGLGATGLDTARVLSHTALAQVDSVTVYGGLKATESEATKALRDAGCSVVLGSEDIEGTYDLAVCSPGIPENSPFRLAAKEAATELISEPELAWRLSPAHWVAISGTNGKTTTTALAQALMQEGGMSALAVGNIGDTCINAVDTRDADTWLVAELSSFQLAGTSSFHPHAAALLNITPDHIEWHGSFEAYVEAKKMLFASMDAQDLAVVSVDDEDCRAIAAALEERGLRVLQLTRNADPGTANCAFVRNGMLVVRLDGAETELLDSFEMQLKGSHNHANALAAAAIALFCGAGVEGVRRCLRSFGALEHRIEPAGRVDGVDYINDSKATNVDSTEKALTAFAPGTIVLMLGGHDKGTALDELAQHIALTCKAIVCYGEAQERFVRDLSSVQDAGVALYTAPHMREALDLCRGIAAAGDTVLLSPACSSYDEFDNFEQRGHLFKEWVAAFETRGQEN